MTIRRILIYTAVIMLGGVLGANVYNSIIDAQNWGSAIPQSLDAAKAYFSFKNPGDFYRIASPLAQVSALIALIAAWPAGKRTRIIAAFAVAFAVFGDVLTFGFFYPRNEIMFGGGTHSVEELRAAWSGWSTVNWFRSLVCLGAVVSELVVLSRFERHSSGLAIH